MTNQELKDEAAIEFGCEVLEGYYEAVDISPPDTKKGLHAAIFMLEAFMEREYSVLFENKLAQIDRKLDS